MNGERPRSAGKRRLLIGYHSQFGATARMAEAAHAGAKQIDNVGVVLKRAADADVDDLLGCDPLIVATMAAAIEAGIF